MWCAADSALSSGESDMLSEHLAGCAQCRAREAEIASTLALLNEWPPCEAMRDYGAFVLGARKRVDRQVGLPGMRRWVAGGLATMSIVCGVIAGLSTRPAQPSRTPSEQEVASAIDLHTFGDVIEGSITYNAETGSDATSVKEKRL